MFHLLHIKTYAICGSEMSVQSTVRVGSHDAQEGAVIAYQEGGVVQKRSQDKTCLETVYELTIAFRHYIIDNRHY